MFTVLPSRESNESEQRKWIPPIIDGLKPQGKCLAHVDGNMSSIKNNGDSYQKGATKNPPPHEKKNINFSFLNHANISDTISNKGSIFSPQHRAHQFCFISAMNFHYYYFIMVLYTSYCKKINRLQHRCRKRRDINAFLSFKCSGFFDFSPSFLVSVFPGIWLRAVGLSLMLLRV